MDLLAAAGAALALAGWTPTAQAEIEKARVAQLGRAVPFATASAEGAFGRPAEVMSFYLYWDKPYGAPDRRRGFAARRARWEQEPVRVDWAVSHDCPALEPLLVRLEELEAPRINVPVLGRPDPRFITADGVSYTLHASWTVWNEHLSGALQMGSNVETPLAQWVEAARSELQGCWRDSEPVADQPTRR